MSVDVSTRPVLNTPVRSVAASNAGSDPTTPTPHVSVADGVALAKALGPGETFRASVNKDGVFEAQKSGGQSRFDAAADTIKGYAWGAASTVLGTIDAAAGLSPSMTVLQLVQSANSLMSSNSLIPSSVSGFVTASFYPWFRLITPALDALQLTNTIKVGKAQRQLDQLQQKQPDGPPPKQSWFQKLLAPFKNSNSLTIGVDALHLGVDVGLAAVIGGYLLQGFTAAVIMPAFLPAWLTLGAALSIGYGVDLACGIWHGLGATGTMLDRNEGATPSERTRKFSFHNMLGRVLDGKEPLLHPDNPPVDPPAGPDDGPAAPPAAKKTDVQPPATASAAS